MKPRKVMIHIESTNLIPISSLKKSSLVLNYVKDNSYLSIALPIDQITVQVVKGGDAKPSKVKR